MFRDSPGKEDKADPLVNKMIWRTKVNVETIDLIRSYKGGLIWALSENKTHFQLNEITRRLES